MSGAHRRIAASDWFGDEVGRRRDEANTHLRFSHEFAQSGLKGLFLANGGAMVSLLTFIGNTNVSNNPRALFWAFVWFSTGLALALASYVAGFLAQSFHMNAAFNQSKQAESDLAGVSQSFDSSSYERKGERAAILGLVLAVVSLVLFVVGSFVALIGIT
ncbi:hypothetical protein FSZ31_02095 [Sphingorhabdus soli]|uniref:Uncharacterized protein n=1 Tax=Flavisphingopyxis soli TaxID=2601267 RepID=A0A5C6UM27_9SPHN|nr:hypothetical protein [Sphingorhabdus soli]TXC73560.1 hypothetical protein FSZ31_02095 [Sphingorhabdus soli]